jgi:hypothetical protein
MLSLRGEAPQLQPHPDVSPLDLPDAGSALIARTKDLYRALSATAQWRRFEGTSATLDDDDIASLKDVRRDYRQRVSDDEIDAVAPDNLMRRHRFRDVMLAEAVDRAQDRSRDYLDAFAEVDGLLSAVVRVIEHGVVFGPPKVVGSVVEGVWRAAPFGKRVRLVTTAEDLFSFRPGLVEVSSEVSTLGGIVLGEHLSVSFEDMMTTARAALAGVLLPESADAVTAGPAW